LRLHIRTVSPPSVTSSGIKCAFSLDKTSTNFLKLAKLRRVRNSSSFSLRSRGCMMLIRWSLCGHVMQPTAGLASSVIKASLESIRSSRARRLTARVRIRASSRGQMSPNSGEISTSPITQQGSGNYIFYKHYINHNQTLFTLTIRSPSVLFDCLQCFDAVGRAARRAPGR